MHQQIYRKIYSQAKEIHFVHYLLPYPLDDYFKYAQKVQRGSIQIVAGKKHVSFHKDTLQTCLNLEFDPSSG